jgi:hypothetical protein
MSVAVTHGRSDAGASGHLAPPPKRHGETPPPSPHSDIATLHGRRSWTPANVSSQPFPTDGQAEL